jgi:hypothetical protein
LTVSVEDWPLDESHAVRNVQNNAKLKTKREMRMRLLVRKFNL